MTNRRLLGMLLAIAVVGSGLACDRDDPPAAPPRPSAAPARQPVERTWPITNRSVRVGLVLPSTQPYYEAVRAGANTMAHDLATVELTIAPGPAGSPATSLASWQPGDFDVIAVAPHDATAMAPTLKVMREAGVRIVSYETDMPSPSERIVHLAPVDPTQAAARLVDELALTMAADGDVAMILPSPAAEQQAWAVQVKQRLTKFPGMKLVATEAIAAPQDAGPVLSRLVTAHPFLRGLIVLSPAALPDVALAVKSTQRRQQLAVVGLGATQPVKPFVDDGTIRFAITWDPVELGQVAVHAADSLASGRLRPGDKTYWSSVPPAKDRVHPVIGDVILLSESPTLMRSAADPLTITPPTTQPALRPATQPFTPTIPRSAPPATQPYPRIVPPATQPALRHT